MKVAFQNQSLESNISKTNNHNFNELSKLRLTFCSEL